MTATAGIEPGFEFVEGATSDLAFAARGPTLGAAFAAAAEAMLAATVEQPESVERRVERTIALEEPDVELLLLRFLNELVYLRDAEELLLHPGRIEVGTTSPCCLTAALHGERIDRERHHLASEVKAATAHGLHVGRADGGWSLSATLDV